MSDAPLLGSPTAIGTHEDGQFSVEFAWAKAPDAVWLKVLADLMRRSGRESVTADADGLTVTFQPEDADAALDDLVALLEEADRSFVSELENRAAAILHVQDALSLRYGTGPDLPVREA
jgi:hypothetical protein